MTYADTVTPDDLVATVEKTGYTAKLPPPPQPDGDAGRGEVEPADELRGLRTRVWVSLVLTVPVIALAMVPAWQFAYWQWLSLTLAAPVVVYGGLPFHKAAWTNLRHGAATMDTLVSIGTLAAFGWSLWALFFGTAGMTHPFSLDVVRTNGAGNIYLEAAGVRRLQQPAPARLPSTADGCGAARLTHPPAGLHRRRRRPGGLCRRRAGTMRPGPPLDGHLGAPPGLIPACGRRVTHLRPCFRSGG